MDTYQTFKCKMCGGDIQAVEGAAFGTCDSCGTTSTLPKANDSKFVNLFNRANHFRRLNEFDKALSAYESILNEDAANAEAHWCAVLCRYGIEYVEDPRTHERVPTCHRTQYTPILTDADYLAALEYSPDTYTRGLYESEAQKISEIQKGILAISNCEEPFDVFICYKETTDGGSRTKDSVLAQEIYQQLINDYRVFFSKITLEDKLGQEYEPYIFAALNSAKVMLVIGTKPEHFNAVWVKNEWSRFLSLMKNDRSRLLIPCYRDMDVYDLPEELSMFQSQDMGKIGFLQDLVRGIRKIVDSAQPVNKTTDPTVQNIGVAPNIESLMKRGQLFLEDKDWKQADEYFDKVLDINPELSLAYIGKLCAEYKICKEEELEGSDKPLSDCKFFRNAIRYSDDQQRLRLLKIDEISKKRFEVLELFRKAKYKVAAGYNCTVGLLTNGTVKLACYGYSDKTEKWQNIVAICTSGHHVVGLDKNGRATAADLNFHPLKPNDYERTRCEVSSWRGIKAIAAAYPCTMGLKTDGTVVTTFRDSSEMSQEISVWKNIIAIAAGEEHCVGLTDDGKVLTAGSNKFSQCDTANWSNMVAIAAGYYFTAGLQSNGTVIFCGTLELAMGTNKDGSTWIKPPEPSKGGIFSVTGWENIVSIAAGYAHIVGLKMDGSVVAVGGNGSGECNVSDWRDIRAVAAGRRHTIGLKADGTVVSTGDNSNGQCNVSDWSDIGIPFEDRPAAYKEEKRQEQELAKQQAEQKKKQQEQEMQEAAKRMNVLNEHREWRKQARCGFCGGKLSIMGKCKSCGKTFTDWDTYGETELINELDIGKAILAQSRDWYNKNLCWYCGGELTIFTDKCKGCGRKKTDWIQTEKDLIKEYNIKPDNFDGFSDKKREGSVSFRMTIRQLFVITGRGAAAVGVIEAGSISVNDYVEITGPNTRLKSSTVIGIEINKNLVNAASEGQMVGILLKDLTKADVEVGDVIQKFD